MSNSHYQIRNYRPADFDNYVRFNIEVEKLGPTGRGVLPQVLGEDLSRPNYSPEEDLFIIEVAGNIIGYLDITPELGIGRVILHCLIHPEHRRRGLASRLFGHAVHRTRELGLKTAQVNISQDNEVAKSVLSKLGFSFIRRFLQLRLDVTKANWQKADQVALPCCHLQRSEEDKLTQIQNRSFADTWGYNPNTAAETVYRTNLSNCSPEDVLLTSDGDKVIGYCWTITTGEAATGSRKGQILMLGVDPDYRGKGIGKGVLSAGLSYLRSKGVQVVELTVDSSNQPACALYRSAGFKVRSSSLWYEKVID